MLAHRLLGHDQRSGYSGVGPTLGHEGQYLTLAGGEPVHGVVPLTAEEAKRLVQSLKLRVLVPTEPIREFKGSCTDTPPFDSGYVQMFRTSALRPPELKLRSGAAFDYLYLFHHPASATACIQVLYTPEGVKLPEASMVR